MPQTETERCATIRVSDDLDAKRKPDPKDLRTIFACRLRDKVRYCPVHP